MNINGTIFIQACNFFVAYLILRFFYFKPAAHAIQKEQAVKADLQVSIATLQATIAAKQYEQKKQAREHQVYYEKNTPDAAQALFDFVKGAPAPLLVNYADQLNIKQIQNDFVAELLRKVDHV